VNAVEGILFGLEVAVTPENLLAALLGALVGTILGLLPGLGPVAGAAVLLPLTFTMSPTAGLIMLAGIYYGVMYGGSTTSVLLNIPGEAPSVIAAIEGYEFTKQGRPGPALGIIAIASFVGGTGSVVLVTFFTPVLARAGLLFGPAEFFALTLGGLLVLSRVLGGSMAAGFFPMVLGLLLATVGADGLSGRYRFTYGHLELSRGFTIVALAVGLFGVSELIRIFAHKTGFPNVPRLSVRSLLPTKEEFTRSVAPWARGGLLGFAFGLMPGPSGTLATFGSYRLEKAVSKGRKEFGTGAVEGLAGPEAANNAAATSSIVPILALGIPFSATLSLMLAALQVHGITPGPLIVERHPEIFWGVIASMFVGNVMLLFLNIPLIGVWVSFLRIPTHYLFPSVVLIALAGAFAARQSIFDLWAMLLLGLIGYLFLRIRFQLAPVIVGFMLGPLIEKHFREGMVIARGDWTFFITQPLAATIWGLVLVGFALGVTRKLMRTGEMLTPTGERPTSTEGD
jgi:putative tricarboxylic transport membrane protein